MSDRAIGARAEEMTRDGLPERGEEAAQPARVLSSAEAELGVIVQDIPLDAIEPDPAQPRRLFDEDVRSLAASIRKYGILQEPAVVQVACDGGRVAPRFPADLG